MTYERVNQPKVEPYKLLANETCHWFWILLPSKVSPSGRPAGGYNKKENPPALRATSFTKGGFNYTLFVYELPNTYKHNPS